MRMNVLFLTKYDLSFGGVAEVLLNIGMQLQKMGVKVVIYSSDESAGGILPCGLESVHGPLPKPGIFGGSIRPLVEVCRKHEIDLVHAHAVYRTGEAVIRLKKKLGIPYLVTSHGDISRESSRMHRGSVRRRCARIFSLAGAVTNLTTAMEQDALSICDIPTGKRFVIPNGLDLDWWREPVKGADGNYIFAIGRHDPAKGFQFVIRAYRELRQRRPGLSLVLAGMGPYTEALHQLTRELGLSLRADLSELAGDADGSVYFPGPVMGELKKSLYRGSQLVTFSSQQGHPESFGLVQIEAMAAGKALVCGDIPASRCIVKPQRNGLLVPSNDVAAWVSAMTRLLEDSTLRNAIEAANLDDARQYDWEVVAAQYKAVYDQVLAGAIQV